MKVEGFSEQIRCVKMVLNFSWFFFQFFNISVKYCFISFVYLHCCKLFEIFNPRINKTIIIILFIQTLNCKKASTLTYQALKGMRPSFEGEILKIMQSILIMHHHYLRVVCFLNPQFCKRPSEIMPGRPSVYDIFFSATVHQFPLKLVIVSDQGIKKTNRSHCIIKLFTLENWESRPKWAQNDPLVNFSKSVH